jgi:hypothetical protein
MSNLLTRYAPSASSALRKVAAPNLQGLGGDLIEIASKGEAFNMNTKSFFAAILGAGFAMSSYADVTLADFESGGLSGWSQQGTAWTVTGGAGSFTVVNAQNPIPSVNFVNQLTPGNGQFVARSGAPSYWIGPMSETNTGILTSAAYKVTYDTLSWNSSGWSGASYDGKNQFQVLDSNFNVKATFATAQSDSWTTVTTNLIQDGFAPGATFYFRAIDANNATGFSWIAVDNLKLSGTAVTAVPEPESYAMLLAGLGLIGAAVKRRKAKQA